MTRISFTDWLTAQVGRQDAVGDLALSYDLDAEVAPRATTVAEVYQRMREVKAKPAFYAALEQAAEEYRQLVVH